MSRIRRMRRVGRTWAIGIVFGAMACSSKSDAPEALAEPETVSPMVMARGPASERGLDKASAVPKRGGYPEPPKFWDTATIRLDDAAHGARACQYDANTIVAQFDHGESETVYTVRLSDPPAMTASSEGMTDEADWMRMQTEEDLTTYEGRFGKDHDDFRAKRVTIEAPASLCSCR